MSSDSSATAKRAHALRFCSQVDIPRNKCFFVKLRNRVVGLARAGELNALRISSLAVAPEVRRFGIASCVLNYAERLAKRLDKYFELLVLKNLAARNLYTKYGFSQKEEMKRNLIIAKKVRQDSNISLKFGVFVRKS
jgi:ribosomal protein S18 acetylase RimI-like enzyme